MSHIFTCEILNNREENNLKYEDIFNGKLEDKVKIFRKFEENLEIRENLMNPEPPCDSLESVMDKI